MVEDVGCSEIQAIFRQPVRANRQAMHAPRGQWDASTMKSTDPVVSVVVTTYNGSLLIDQTIASVLSQTFRDFELIVVDDLSTDNTVACVERYVDPRIRLMRNSRNLGVVGSRNVGFSLARGRYIAALDHDDLSVPERLERQVGYLDAHPDVVLVGSRWLNFSNGQTSLDPYEILDPPLVRWALHLSNIMCYSTLMVRTACLRRLNPPMRQERVLADDFDFYHRLLRLGEIARLPEPLVIYRLHGSNTFRLRMHEMQHNAALVLEDAYKAWFDTRAGAVSQLMTRLVAGREVARTDEELNQLRHHLEHLADSFIRDNKSSAGTADAILASVEAVWILALERRIRRNGLSVFRYASQIWATSSSRRASLLKAAVFALVPAKALFRSVGHLAKDRLSARSTSTVPEGFPKKEAGLDASSPTWDYVSTWLVMVFCIPSCAWLLGRMTKKAVMSLSSKRLGK